MTHSYVPQGTPGAGQIASSTRADGSILSYSYDLHSRQQFVGGNGTWPIRYEYDWFGALWKMHTYRTGSPGVASEGDLTVWQRDPATGTLLNKEDALGNSTAYVPEASTGRLTQRQWMRAIGGQRLTTAYQYNVQGLLLSVDYSDATPDVVNTFDAAGRLTSTQDASGAHSHSYSGPAGAWSGETVTGGLLPGLVLAKTFDASGRKTAFTWTFAGESRTINYGYDTAGRLATVSAFGHSATYSYSGTDGKKTGLTYAGSPGLSGEWVYDSRGRVESTNWKRGIETLVSNQYAYDEMNRRISATREDGQQWRYAYNDRGEVGSAVKAMSSDPEAGLRSGLQTSYSYDLMGNRSGLTTHTPTGLETLIWLHNGANQLTSRQTPSGTWVRGRLHEDAVLGTIVGGGTPSRSGTTFDVPVTLNNAGQSEWRLLEMNASRQGMGVNGGEVRQKRRSHLWLQGAPEALTYDLDGNLTGDGRWQYEWDGENRLKAMQTGSTALAAGVPGVRMEFSYDSLGRRVRKLRKDLAGAVPVTVSDLRFIYDDWNLLAEFECVSGTPLLVRTYSWGLDLSGTEQGAGGVGGLVSMQDAATTTVFGPCYDANGNVVAYSSLTTGNLALILDYDAFGAVVEEERLAAASNAVQFPFRLSTKYEDESGLNYYGYRYYSPMIGGWTSRDPIEEAGGNNLYVNCDNNMINYVDLLGMKSFLIGFYGLGSPTDFGNTWLEEIHKAAGGNSSFLFKHGRDEEAIRQLLAQIDTNKDGTCCAHEIEGHEFKVVSYSWGGPTTTSLTNKLNLKAGQTSKKLEGFILEGSIPFKVVVTVDPVTIGKVMSPAGENVKRWVNYFQKRRKGKMEIWNRGKLDRIQHFGYTLGSSNFHGKDWAGHADRNIDVPNDWAKIKKGRRTLPSYTDIGVMMGSEVRHDTITWFVYEDAINELK